MFASQNRFMYRFSTTQRKARCGKLVLDGEVVSTSDPEVPPGMCVEHFRTLAKSRREVMPGWQSSSGGWIDGLALESWVMMICCRMCLSLLKK